MCTKIVCVHTLVIEMRRNKGERDWPVGRGDVKDRDRQGEGEVEQSVESEGEGD